jgi:oxaloacetate decarboxylase beta subunit
MGFFVEVLQAIFGGSGFAALDWRTALMLVIACVLLYMGIGKGFEPLLLVPIAFGMLLANLPLTGLFAEPLYDPATHSGTVGFMWVLYQGVQYAIYPSIIFMGIGAMTDFGPLLANPTALLLGAAAQLGIFAAFLMALCVDPITSALHSVLPFIPVITFSPADAAAIGVIGGADGPTAILTASKLAVKLLPAIAIAAYSYMALIPMIQPPLMKALTSKESRKVKMSQLRTVSKTEKIIFPIAVTIFVVLLIPDTAPLIGMLMLGNLFRECGVTERLSDTAQNALINIVTIPLGLSVGFKATASEFLKGETLFIIVLGLTAFLLSTAGGLILGNVMYIVTKGKVNPLIGSAGVSAVPMAARVSQNVGQKENPSNFLLMHAMGPNVAGVIGSACAAGFMIKVFGG